ncbi:type IX secretion system membrane protein PorP/SprF [Pedobacter sp. HMF7647]|uniref:Type IX secretion system membrane protein PorP/SprF n=1 Tax=Hufsiella arboris TaxID=2695275 RepID=A0A7K1YC75_9SPHI|nr:type IX secretion system membrane protein PorP/SprF [Hufsiella arboris]MXV52186.1 type IX secretion system membrane protein PorP/SprF [Hufsiella arboris]
MKLKRKREWVLGILMTVGCVKTSTAQQNIQFTQYIFNSLSINPAYAGYKEEWFVQTAMRAQWVGIEGSPKTGQVSIDGVADPDTKRMGLGLQITADKLGPQSVSSIYANYAYRIQMDDDDTKRLSFGLAAGFAQYTLDGSMINTVSGTDLALPTGKISDFVPDFRFGVYYYSPTWYAGASVMDMLSGGNSRSVLFKNALNTLNLGRTRHLYFMTGAMLNLSDGFMLRPSLLVKEDFKGPTSLDLNAMFIFGTQFWIGGSYRTGVKIWNKNYLANQSLSNLNSLSALAQVYVSERIRIGYSYDYVISQLSDVQNGSHEITLGFTFPNKRDRYLSPRFF